MNEVIRFAKEATAQMASTLQKSVELIRADPIVTFEERKAYALILREQADLCLAAAESLERP